MTLVKKILILACINVYSVGATSIRTLVERGAVSIENKGLRLPKKGITSLDGLDGIPGIQLVEYLNLSDNLLKELPSGIFRKLGNLVILKLDNNEIKNLPPGIFDSLGNLVYLDLSHNKLSMLDQEIFSKTTKLQSIDLGYNKLSILPSEIFRQLRKLQYLHLENNKLVELPKLTNLAHLEMLNLKNNRFGKIDFNGADLKSLTKLYISGNPLQSGVKCSIFDPSSDVEIF